MTIDAARFPDPASPATRLPIRGPALVLVRFGWLALAALTMGIFITALPTAYYQQIIKGLVLVFAIGLDVYKTKRQSKA